MNPDLLSEHLNRLQAWDTVSFKIKVGADWVSDIDRIREAVPYLKAGEKAMADAQPWMAIGQCAACSTCDA